MHPLTVVLRERTGRGRWDWRRHRRRRWTRDGDDRVKRLEHLLDLSLRQAPFRRQRSHAVSEDRSSVPPTDQYSTGRTRTSLAAID